MPKLFVLVLSLGLTGILTICGCKDADRPVPSASQEHSGENQELPALSLPKEVHGGQQILSDWLDGFVDKTQEQVEKQLGTASDKTTWDFKDNKELRLQYKTSEKGTLTLLFLGHRVIKASYVLFSE